MVFVWHCRKALNLGILRDPGSEVEDRQYQIDLQSLNIGTAHWNQLKPEKEAGKGGALTESERNSQNPALEWNMASRWEPFNSLFAVMAWTGTAGTPHRISESGLHWLCFPLSAHSHEAVDYPAEMHLAVLATL